MYNWSTEEVDPVNRNHYLPMSHNSETHDFSQIHIHNIVLKISCHTRTPKPSPDDICHTGTAGNPVQIRLCIPTARKASFIAL
jgi:hypothetical protein